MKKIITSLMLLIMAVGASAGAYDFTAKVSSGQTLYFRVLDESAKTVAVCNETGGHSFRGWVSKAYSSDALRPSGALVIPAQITNGGKTYKVTTIDTLAFYQCKGITSVVVPEGVTTIGPGAMEELANATKITLPSSLVNLFEDAFRESPKAQIDLSKTNIATLYEYTFLYNNAIKELRLPESLTRIENYSLYDLQAVETIHIGANVNYLDADQAFDRCSNLKSVYLSAVVPPKTGYNYFSSSVTSSVTLYVPESSLEDYSSDKYWKQFSNIQPFNPSGGTTYHQVQVSINDAKMGSIKVNGIDISNATATTAVKQGDNLTINVVPSGKEYRLKTLTVNGIDVTSQVKNNQYNAGAITAKGTISVEFEKTPIVIYLKVVGSGASFIVKKYYGEPFEVVFGSLTSKPIRKVTVNYQEYPSATYSVEKLTDHLVIEVTPADIVKADVNEDSSVNGADVVAIYNYIINGK